MRVFLKDKITEITAEEVDVEKGDLIDDVLITHVPAREERAEVSHYETVREYPNGGKDVIKIIDSPAVSACEEHDETEKIQVFIPFTAEQLEKKGVFNQVELLKARLMSTDYMAIKYAEGIISEDEFKSVRDKRAEWRAEINELEKSL